MCLSKRREARVNPDRLRLARSLLDRARAAANWRADLVLKSDGGGWVLDEFCRQLQIQLQSSMAVYVSTVPVPGLRDRIVHFIGSECFYDPNWRRSFHDSNEVIGTWWHGSPATPDPSIQSALARVPDVSRRLARVHVTCTISQQVVREIGVPEAKIALVPMGVNTDLFRPPDSPSAREQARALLGISPDVFVIGSFQKDGIGWDEGSAPKRIKGPDVFADVLARLSGRHPIFALIPGPARGYLKGRLASAGVPFRSDGFLPFRSLPSYYHACDMYLMTGREEGGPAAVLESLACGTPLVGHRVGMAPDVISEGVDGLLADVDDLDRLVEHCEQLIGSAGLRHAVANAGLATARKYAWPAVAPRYERLYHSVASEHVRTKTAGRPLNGVSR
jgi:glycosyltransferase involved in cell wall biosynthesis